MPNRERAHQVGKFSYEKSKTSFSSDAEKKREIATSEGQIASISHGPYLERKKQRIGISYMVLGYYSGQASCFYNFKDYSGAGADSIHQKHHTGIDLASVCWQ